MLSRDDVLEIAQLARLALDDDEIDSMRGELSAILDHIDALQTVDTKGVEPMTHAVPMDLRLRVDEAQKGLDADTATAAAATIDDGCFVVPHIIKSAS